MSRYCELVTIVRTSNACQSPGQNGGVIEVTLHTRIDGVIKTSIVPPTVLGLVVFGYPLKRGCQEAYSSPSSQCPRVKKSWSVIWDLKNVRKRSLLTNCCYRIRRTKEKRDYLMLKSLQVFIAWRLTAVSGTSEICQISGEFPMFVNW